MPPTAQAITSQKQAWVFLNHVPWLGPERFHQLLNKLPDAAEVLRLDAKGLQLLGVSSELARQWAAAFQDKALRERVDDEFNRASRGEFRIVCELEDDYPERLKNFSDRPPVLYVQGRWPLEARFSLGLVGTRRATPYGLDCASQFARDLAERGVVTISGLAAGIDAAVHRATLDARGWTVAVLGHGLQFQYPSANRPLYKEIKQDGTIVTEFTFGCPPEAGQFPRRNRIISGLAEGVVVIEAPVRSGAMITARYAAEQGREVYVVPGSIFQPQLSGGHRLIQNGAKLVTSVDEILESTGQRAERRAAPEGSSLPSPDKISALLPLEQAILKNLLDEPVSVDSLASLLGVPVDQLANALLSLELKQLIRQHPGQRYAAKNS